LLLNLNSLFAVETLGNGRNLHWFWCNSFAGFRPRRRTSPRYSGYRSYGSIE